MNKLTVKKIHGMLFPTHLFQAFLLATMYEYIITYAKSERKPYTESIGNK